MNNSISSPESVSFHWRETQHAHPGVWNVLRNQTFLSVLYQAFSSREKAWLREAMFTRTVRKYIVASEPTSMRARNNCAGAI